MRTASSFVDHKWNSVANIRKPGFPVDFPTTME